MTVLSIFLKKSIFLIAFFSLAHCQSSGLSPKSTAVKAPPISTWKRPAPLKIDLSKDVIDTVLQTPHFRFITHNSVLNETDVKEIATACENSLEVLQVFTGNSKKIVPINYHIYSSIEQKALRKKTIKTVSIEEEANSVCIVQNQHFQGNQLSIEHKLLIRQLLPKATITALEDGLSKHFTKKWQQRGYAYWCGQLYLSNNLPPLEELLNEEVYQNESPLVMGAMSGVFVDFLIGHFGQTDFLKKFGKWTKEELLILKPKWDDFLKKQYSDFEIVRNKRSISGTPLKGFNFAHEGYRIYNGYGSQLAKESLEQLASINSNAVSIVPYSFMRDPRKPRQLLIEHRDGGENDESVLFAHFEAQQLGMHTMLKPQIWVRGSWPGDIQMSSEADWRIFFDAYYRWMRHYALLAEINGFDSLCIGVEFSKATLAKEKEWRHLIQQIRGIYNGPLTYAANWGTEFEQLQFWDMLDFIGLNCYYPLSKEAQPSKRTLKKGFEKVIQKIEKVTARFKKPLVFTEIGFRSVDGTWKDPHEDDQGRNFNEQSQALAYEVIFEGVHNKDWYKGIFWWKWPSYLEYKGPINTGFAPTNKKAEEVAKKWFEKTN